MPLTHVCVWDSELGYCRVTVEEASVMYPHSTVSARSGHFVCELCAQNVCFTAPGANSRHFRHDSAAQNKDCEDRQQSYDRPIVALNEHVMPIRIQVSGNTFILRLGFFLPHKINAQNLRCEKIRIATDSHKPPYEYLFDRVSSTGITYLDVGNCPSQVYGIEYIQPSIELKKFWPTKIPGINPNGALFDKESGKLLQAGGKAYTEKTYYLMQRGTIGLHSDINAKEVMRFQARTFEWWYLYEISSQRFSERAAQFFLQRSIFLSETPLDFYPIWPVYVADPYFIYHEQAEMFFYLAGTYADLKSYPITSEYLAPKSEPVENGKLIRIFASNKEQLLSLGVSGALGFSYLLRQDLNMRGTFPLVTIKDFEENILEQDLYTSIPKKKGITISAPFDGKVILLQSGKVQKELPLTGESATTVDPISLGLEIKIYQGCDCVRTIAFQKETLSSDNQIADQELIEKLSACHGPLISVSHSFGAVAGKLRSYPKTRQWIYKAIRKGVLPRTAYNLLTRHIETIDRRN